MGRTTMSRRRFLNAAGVAAAAVALAPRRAPAQLRERELRVLQQVSFIKGADAEYDRQAQEWGKSNRVKVTVERVGSADIQTRVAAAIQAKAGPDVVELQANWAWLYEESLTNLTDVAERFDKAVGGIYADLAALDKVKGVWRGIPYYYQTNAVIYRTDYFREAGAKIPATWDEFIAEGKTMKKYGKPFGQAMGHTIDPWTFYYPWLWSHGGKEVEADGKTVAINSPETIEAVEKSLVLFDEVWARGALAWDDTSNNRVYLAGQISATVNASSVYLVARRDFPEVAKQSAHFKNPSGPKGFFVYPAQTHVGVPTYSKSQDVAKEWLNHHLSADNYYKYLDAHDCFGAGVGPKMLAEHKAWDRHPELAAFRETILARGARWPGFPGPPSKQAGQAFVRFIVIDMFAKAAAREYTPKEAVEWAERQLQGIYKG